MVAPPERRTVEAVIFDWGGTLTPWFPIDPLEPWLAYARGAGHDEALARRVLAAEEARWAAQRTSGGAHGTGPLAELFDECGVDTDTEAHRRGLAEYLRWWEPLTVSRPEAADVLVAIRDRGIRVGVLSNTQWPAGHHDAVLERDGLRHLVDGAVYTSELPVGKPHPDAFLAALAAVGVADPAAAVFVGDRPYDDVHGAQSVGMRGVLVDHGSHVAHELVDTDSEPDGVITSLTELLGLLDGWAP